MKKDNLVFFTSNQKLMEEIVDLSLGKQDVKKSGLAWQEKRLGTVDELSFIDLERLLPMLSFDNKEEVLPWLLPFKGLWIGKNLFDDGLIGTYFLEIR